jgi:hypothetical protein
MRPAGARAAKGQFLEGALDLVAVLLFIYILSTLRRLLNSRFRFYDVDVVVSLLIALGIILTVAQMLPVFRADAAGAAVLEVASALAFSALGIGYIVLGVRLRRLSGNPFGLLKPYAYTLLAFGVCAASIVLSPVAMVVGAVSDVILGLIFLRAARLPHSE